MFVIVQIVLIVSISTLEKSKGSIPPKLPAVPGPGQCDPEGPALQKVGERRPMLDCWMRQDAHPGICVRRVEDFRRSRLMAFCLPFCYLLLYTILDIAFAVGRLRRPMPTRRQQPRRCVRLLWRRRLNQPGFDFEAAESRTCAVSHPLHQVGRCRSPLTRAGPKYSTANYRLRLARSPYAPGRAP